MKIHIALVSDQVLANLIPALMERPDLVVLACSRDMAAKGLDRRLQRLMAAESIPAEVQPEAAPDVGLREIQDYARRLVQDIKAAHPSAELVLNATGGTKLMSLGFVEVFRGVARRILYTDTAHGRIECLPDGCREDPQPMAMADVLDVPRYLAAQGFVYAAAQSDAGEWHERIGRRQALSTSLGVQAPQLQGFVGAINALASQALERVSGTRVERLVQPHQRLYERPHGRWAAALEQIAEAGLVEWHRGSQDLCFADAESALFLRGGWLEEYTWHRLQAAGLHDARLGVTGHWEGSPQSENEFDALACHLNQLLFIECKTLRFREENDNPIAYKLDSLSRDARGLFGATWLLSAREPSRVLAERARQARFRILGPQQLPRLGEAVTDWMGAAKYAART